MLARALAFGPDRKLYIAAGDGGSGNDPQNNSQNLGNLLGKILRLNDDGSIPADNPFVSQGGARGEIWALGLRNPWRMSFDRNTGDLWCGDVGQNAVEEIDIIVRGANYGWRVYEGDRSNINPSILPPTAFTQPIVTYTHSFGFSVTGGYVYRGTRVPSLSDAYMYADFVTNRVWALVWDGNQVVSNTQVMTASVIPLEDLDRRYTQGVVIRVDESRDARQGLENLHEILRNYPGDCELRLLLRLADGRKVHMKCSAMPRAAGSSASMLASCMPSGTKTDTAITAAKASAEMLELMMRCPLRVKRLLRLSPSDPEFVTISLLGLNGSMFPCGGQTEASTDRPFDTRGRETGNLRRAFDSEGRTALRHRALAVLSRRSPGSGISS